MKKAISTIVAMAFISSMLVTTVYADNYYSGGINPAWIPVAIFTTLAAVAIAQPQPVVYERHIHHEPVRTVIYKEPRYYRYARLYKHRPHNDCYDEHERSYEERGYRDYR
jgi:hypothetical protein